ncbi:hypothetical protein D5S17_28415 [Pseudonocardiaceae bacterium YIM PH 21723]|nr:hypothetical protein D5S17_28415 [Pseudonocardiaceae bacterium YIM PH 21723]
MIRGAALLTAFALLGGGATATAAPQAGPYVVNVVNHTGQNLPIVMMSVKRTNGESNVLEQDDLVNGGTFVFRIFQCTDVSTIRVLVVKPDGTTRATVFISPPPNCTTTVEWTPSS